MYRTFHNNKRSRHRALWVWKRFFLFSLRNKRWPAFLEEKCPRWFLVMEVITFSPPQTWSHMFVSKTLFYSTKREQKCSAEWIIGCAWGTKCSFVLPEIKTWDVDLSKFSRCHGGFTGWDESLARNWSDLLT